jgi:hypothetical protein
VAAVAASSIVASASFKPLENLLCLFITYLHRRSSSRVYAGRLACFDFRMATAAKLAIKNRSPTVREGVIQEAGTGGRRQGDIIGGPFYCFLLLPPAV